MNVEPSAAAFHCHTAAMHLDEMAHDREPKAEPGVSSRRRAIDLAKALEDERQMSGGMPALVS